VRNLTSGITATNRGIITTFGRSRRRRENIIKMNIREVCRKDSNWWGYNAVSLI
jgi:hypothetical protein